jgi:SAM-dependent methyltransferase
LARALSAQHFRGRYLGVDFSPALLQEAERLPLGFAARFVLLELSELPQLVRDRTNPLARVLPPSSFDAVLAFAVLHHVPDSDLRQQILIAVYRLLRPGGRFIHSNWQFLNSPRLRARIQPWESTGLHEGDVDDGDYLLDWRGGGRGLRYVHVFGETELVRLAGATGFRIEDSFYSDGQGGRLSLYQVWSKPGSGV